MGYGGRQKIALNTPINTPPRTNPGQPSRIYPELALKNAQTNDGIIPIIVEMIISSANLRTESGPLGNLSPPLIHFLFILSCRTNLNTTF